MPKKGTRPFESTKDLYLLFVHKARRILHGNRCVSKKMSKKGRFFPVFVEFWVMCSKSDRVQTCTSVCPFLMWNRGLMF